MRIALYAGIDITRSGVTQCNSLALILIFINVNININGNINVNVKVIQRNEKLKHQKYYSFGMASSSREKNHLYVRKDYQH